MLRRVEPPAAPWPAALVGAGDGRGFLVDAADLSPGAFGASAEHVLRPVEVFRTADGHVVRMPLVERRLEPAPTGGPGAAVTLAVSIVRAVGAAEPDLLGEWWCDPDGRPVFVPVAGGTALRTGAAALLRAADIGAAQEVLDELAAELEEAEPLPLDGWEDRLFTLGAPAALQRTEPETRASRRRGRSPRGRSRSRGAGPGAAVSDAGVAVWRSVRRLRGDRRLTAGTAAAAALLVVVVGLAWPVDQDPAATAETVATSTEPVEPADPPPVAAVADAGDPVSRAVALLGQARGCAGDAACLAEVMEDPAKSLPAGPARDDPAASASLVDHLGGIAVVRVQGSDGAAQIVLIVARDGEWLVRDVYDAADQP